MIINILEYLKNNLAQILKIPRSVTRIFLKEYKKIIRIFFFFQSLSTGFFLSSIVTHYRLKGVKDITMETLIDSTKTLQDSINDRSSFVVTEVKEILNDIDTSRNISGDADSAAGDISQQQMLLDQYQQQVDVNLQQHLDHLKQESTKIEQLLLKFDKKLAATITTAAAQLYNQHNPWPHQTTTTTPLAAPVMLPQAGENEKSTISESTKVQANSKSDNATVVDSKVDDMSTSVDIQSVAPQNVVVQYAPLLAVFGSGVLLIYSMFNE